MKKYFIFISFLIFISLHFNFVAMSARTTTSTLSSRRRVVPVIEKLEKPTELECRENIDYCFNRFCFDKKTLVDGVYSKCGAISASQIQINVEDCLDTRGIIKELDLNKGCKDYTYNYVVALLSNKDVIEKGLKKNTQECKNASRALEAAKACWAKTISHDGSIDSVLRADLMATCGYSVSGDVYMPDRFYNAGDYGDANVGAQMDLQLAGINSKKRENWREIVDAVLVGYMELAELACGEEDYSISKINKYLPDSNENLEMIRLKSQASQIGKSTANKIVNSWFRMTDCLNSPLPVGGERWQYVEDGAPDCRLICATGYERGKNSSECVKIDLDPSSFVGFNLGQSSLSIGLNSSPATIKQSGDGYDNFGTGATSCSKSLPNLPFSMSKEGICRVFFPNCSSSGIGSRRWYSRNTNDGEFFCVGDFDGYFNYHVLLTIQNINSVFGTSFSRFGDAYASDASLYLVQNCAKYCTGSVSADCASVPEISVEYEVRKQWDEFLNTHSLSMCTNNEKKRLIELLASFNKADFIGSGRSKASATDVLNVMQQVKDCVCGDSYSSSSSSSSSSSYSFSSGTSYTYDEICNHSLSEVDYTDLNTMTNWYGYTSTYKGSCTNNPKNEILDYIRVLENNPGKKYKGSEKELGYINSIKIKLPSFYNCVCG